MNRQNRNITSKSGILPGSGSDAAPVKGVNRDLNNDTLNYSADSGLYRTFGEYMMGRLDLEEVRKDPSLPGIEIVVREMISDYHANSTKPADNENFIRDNFTGVNCDGKILDEISNIKTETGDSTINEISAEWVNEWNEKRQKNGGKDAKTEEIRDFITSSLEPENNKSEINLNNKEGKGFTRPLLIRYISLSAAAVIGIFILITTLLPSSDPEKLYKSYYEPFGAISSVTRGAAANGPEGYSDAIEKYKNGDYQTAAFGFSKIILNDTSVIAPRFFSGITQLALENYDQAIILLGKIADRPGEFRKEAGWYLGLAYLKTGEEEKATKCFELLAQSPGFYSDRSEKILRRLK